jgi:hypothetical protein
MNAAKAAFYPQRRMYAFYKTAIDRNYDFGFVAKHG